MTKKLIGIIFLILIVLIGIAFKSNAAGLWKAATTPRDWSFPEDFGNHSDYATEWWYFTGNLQDAKGRKFGYQFTVFRIGVDAGKSDHGPWEVRNVFAAHFALTDVENEKFYFSDRLSRKGPGFVEVSQDSIAVRIHNWRIEDLNEGKIGVHASDGGVEINLELAPVKPVVLHGDRGLSKKGPGKTQASHYFSLTRLESKGNISLPDEDKPILVSGLSWFDKEFGSNQLTENQVGWDWFSLQFEDGRELMLYSMRRRDGTIENESSGTLVFKDGTYEHLDFSLFEIIVSEHWQSTKTHANYPSKWKINIPLYGMAITLNPKIKEQEITSEQSTGIVYWEGAVEGIAEMEGAGNTNVSGYIEMTGYAGSLGGIF